MLTKSSNHGWLIAGIVALLIFLSLAVGVGLHAGWLTAIDQPIQQAVRPLASPQRTHFFAMLAAFGTPVANLLVSLLIMGYFAWHRDWFTTGWLVIVQVGIGGWTYLGKYLLHRARPIGKLVAQGGFSFPSGHTTGTATLVLILLFVVIPLFKNWEVQLLLSLVSVIWLGMMGFDRIYLFVHYPTDVLGGLCLAIAWWAVARWGYLRWAPQATLVAQQATQQPASLE